MSLENLTSNLNQLSTTDYFTNDTARGFSKDFKPGTSTKFKPFDSNLGQSDYFTDDYASGFILNMKFPNTGFKLNKVYPFEKTFGERNSSYNFFDLEFKVNRGFKKNFKLRESQYKKVQGKNFTWPLDLKRVDYQGNNLSPISDFNRQYPNMVGGLSSVMSYPESRLRQEFLHSDNQRFRYKTRYEFKKENQIRLDSNSTKHPLILQSLMDVNRYGWAKNRFSNVGHTTDFVRGGITTHLGTALTDQVRLTKFLTSGDGLWWLGKQFVLQYLQPRKETQLYNPLHINASIIPFANVSRFLNLKGSGVADVMGFAKSGKGLYERSDDYEDFGIKPYRKYTNKLAQYTRDRFDPDPPPKPVEEVAAVGKKAIRKAAAKAIFSKLGDGINELAGKFRAESKPANNVDSRKHQQGGLISEDRWTARKKTDYKTLSYDMLDKDNKYVDKLESPRELIDKEFELGTDAEKIVKGSVESRAIGKSKVNSLGNASSPSSVHKNDVLGMVKLGNDVSDKVNLQPYGNTPGEVEDFVKFQFYDKVNKKYIVFRATVTGLTDSITPEWASEKYIGRADSVHVYKGAERTLSFGFTIAPKSKQEMITLWEKLNYLTGLTYPSYNNNKMVSPWVEFTFGHMYNKVPGIIDNLSYNIPDNAPYEIDNFQLPKVIEATMGFKYVGNNLQTMQGKHFDLPWLNGTDNTVDDRSRIDGTSSPQRSEFVNTALNDANIPTLPKAKS